MRNTSRISLKLFFTAPVIHTMIYTFTDHGKMQLSVRAERLFVRLCDEIMGGTKTTPFGFLHSAGKKFSGNPAALIIQGNSDPGKFNGRNEFFRLAVQDIGLRIGVEGDHSGEIMPGLCL